MSEQRVALITGASSGIGQAIAQRLEREGLRVFGTSRDPQRAQAVDGVEMLALDAHSDESVKTCVETVLARAGRLDILINNAGYILIGAAEEVSLVEAQEQFEANFFGALRLVKSTLPIMRRQGGGQIINISGPAGIVPIPFMGLFSASKAALEAYSMALRHEVKRLNIHVSLVLPGPIQTQVVQSSQRAAGRIGAYTPWEDSFLAGWQRGYQAADPPGLVADNVWGILNSRSPKAHYAVGKGIRVFLLMRRLFPEALFEAGMRRFLGLDAESAKKSWDPRQEDGRPT